uniref:NAC domain-containing protein n=1 Tax=Aegilops tauschii TaxID=37682 RepID=M8B0E2_AEGTA
MEGLDVDDVFHHYRLSPTEVEAVTYYLPRLLSGETLHGADKLIHRVEISGCEPKDLAARYAPAPQAVSSGDRFFFTVQEQEREQAPERARRRRRHLEHPEDHGDLPRGMQGRRGQEPLLQEEGQVDRLGHGGIPVPAAGGHRLRRGEGVPARCTWLSMPLTRPDRNRRRTSFKKRNQRP